MRACYCPSCGANLKFEDNNRDFGFCQYCGTKIMFDDFRSTHRYVDEARIKEAEVGKEIRFREIELEQDIKRNKIANKIIIAVFLLIFIIVGGINERIGELGIIVGGFLIIFRILTIFYEKIKSKNNRK